MATRGAITAGSEQSAAAGREMFRRGGNAVDAAVAAAFATAAGDPAITSLAGGGVLLHRSGLTGETTACDFFADAPGLGARTPSAGAQVCEFLPLDVHFRRGDTSQRFWVGRAAGAVPGVIAGLERARKEWGTLPLAEILRPTVAFLRDGIRLSEYQIGCSEILAEILRRSASGRGLLEEASGVGRSAGSLYRNPELADALERLGSFGLEAFEREVLHPALLAEFGEEAGGRITADDLEHYRPALRAPVVFEHCGARVATMPPPSFGGPLVSLTAALFDRIAVGAAPAGSAERFRRLAAAFRAVSEVRAEVPDLTLRPDAPQLLAARLDGVLARGSGGESGREPRTPGNTTHVSAVDEESNAVAVTISYGEGNGYEVPGTGLLMNNLMGEEDLFPAGFASYTPGERLGTMMAPCIAVEPSGAVTALGAGGSNRIRTAIPQVLLALLEDRLAPRDAVRVPRIHVENGVLSAEAFLLDDPDAALEEARRLTRAFKPFDGDSLFFGGVHVARRQANGTLEGAGDPRRAGAVAVV